MLELQVMCYSLFIMKAIDKELIFELLKAASANFYGYEPEVFKNKPNFTDDLEIKENKEVKNENKSEKIEVIKDNSPKEEISGNEERHAITLKELEEKINNCTHCKLCKTKNHSVPGEGVKNPAVLVIGEGPGEEEDKQGRPFVGPAGQLLDKMLAAIQLDRNANCYIANTVKCRPPYNRDPEPDEAASCRAYLDAQIHILKPKIILLVGKVALRNIMKIEGEISLRRYRGKIYEYNGIPMIVTYHPSALLRNADYKRPAWEDLKFFRTKLLELCPDYAVNYNKMNNSNSQA